MAEITLHGKPCNTIGHLPAVGNTAPDFLLTNKDLADVSLADFTGKRKVLVIVPSLDTDVCATSTRKFNQQAARLENHVILVISADLPFAQSRFCGSEGINNIHTLSTFRSRFAVDYGVSIVDGPLAGVTARAVLVLNENNTVIHSQLVGEIGDEPDYDAVLSTL